MENRTPVSRVKGDVTNHYTSEDGNSRKSYTSGAVCCLHRAVTVTVIHIFFSRCSSSSFTSKILGTASSVDKFKHSTPIRTGRRRTHTEHKKTSLFGDVSGGSDHDNTSRRRSHQNKRLERFDRQDGNDLIERRNHQNEKHRRSPTGIDNDHETVPSKKCEDVETLHSSVSFIEDLRKKKYEEQEKTNTSPNQKHIDSSGIRSILSGQKPWPSVDVFELDDADGIDLPTATEYQPTLPANDTSTTNVDGPPNYLPSINPKTETALTPTPSEVKGHDCAQSIASEKYQHSNEGNVDDIKMMSLQQNVNSFVDRSANYHDSVTPINLQNALDLKMIIFGSGKSCFNNEWRRQGFYFSNHQALKYGLVQEKGGPCGLLASVQAWVLCFLLLSNQGTKNGMF